MEEILITETIYPPKPEQNEKKQAIGKSLFSLLAFIVLFYFFFGRDLQSVFMLTLALIIHEMGHFIAMKIFGYKDVNMFFVPLLGAYVTGTKQKISQKQNVIILLAGPVPGIIIGLLLALAGYNSKSEALFGIANIFIYMNLLNLLPIIPLDGGRIVKTLFFQTNEIINTIFILLSIVGMIGLCVLLKSYYLLAIPYFLILQLVGQSQTRKARKEISERDIDLVKTYDELSDREYWIIRDIIGTNIKYYAKYIEPGKYIISEEEDKIINGVTSVLKTPPVKDLKVPGKIIFILVGAACFVVPFFTAILHHWYIQSLIHDQFQF